ncbi:SPOR domain-containing protein [Amaricoccus sp.]|uniref:SPOR domain-containing protein n=1 Tax=Amaricoccus sp. TaxID=1872485 RepID=UPI001B42398C|nr:SPOR domain-containing protein [Amaricoccus sp.]MBP7242025.1 SPOR domain-containing protein [Amaricoccus sp.]
MSELYADEYDSLAGDSGRLSSAGARRIAGAVLFLTLVGGLGLWAYRLGTRDAAEVPIVRAMEGPARLQPEDPGGLRAAHQGLEVNAVLAGRPAPAPAVDTPVAPAPNALADEDAPQGELVVAAPSVVAESALAEGEDLRMPLPDDGPGVAAEATPETAVMAAVAETVLAPAEAPAEEPAAAPEPAKGPGPMRRPSGIVRMTAAAPAAATPAAASATAPAPATREVASVSSGARLVQLGAFDSEGIARQAWNILSRRHADLLGSKSLYVERTTANARVFYRLRVSGFETADQTRQMCEALRARGVDCIPVTLQ